MRKSPAFASAALILFTGGIARAAPSGVDAEYERTIERLSVENAALHYWEAVAELPKTDDEELDEFISRSLRKMPPAAVDEMPGAREELERYRSVVTGYLRRGAAMERCSFDPDWRKGMGTPLPHLRHLRDLTRRAVAYGKYLELEAKPTEAARVYLDVVRMGCHLDQDSCIISVIVGVSVVAVGAQGLEGLLARGPGEETARLAFEGLCRLPERPFDAAGALEVERVVMGASLREHYRKVLGEADEGDVLEALRGLVPLPEAPDTPEEALRLLDRAFAVYDRQMREMVQATRGPYHETRRRVKALFEGHKAYWREEKKKGDFGAAFVDAIMPTVGMFYSRTVLAQARLDGLKLLAAACLEKAETGRYPDSLEALRKRFPAGLPKDPFTGNDFTYWLPDGMPAVACAGDDPELREKRPEAYTFSLSHRLEREKWELQQWRVEHGGGAPDRAAAPGQDEEVW